MINGRIVGMLVAAFVAGSFVASPELRAFAANTVGSADIIDESILSVDIKNGEVKTSDLGGNSVTSAKIKDGEVKTADIAAGAVAAGRIADGAVGTAKIADNSITAADISPDAVGASELQGVSRLIFDDCFESDFSNGSVAAGGIKFLNCTVDGAEFGDEAVITVDPGNTCFVIVGRDVATDLVSILLRNFCGISQDPGSIDASIVVYHS